MARRTAAATARTDKKTNRLLRYLKEVRAEVKRVVWPNRQTTIRLTSIVFTVTVVMSFALGLIDWIFARLFALIIG